MSGMVVPAIPVGHSFSFLQDRSRPPVYDRCGSATKADLEEEFHMSSFERVIPILVYRDIEAAHDFLVNVFGFRSGGVDRDGQGNARHAEVRAGDATIWLHRETEDGRMVSAEKVDTAGSGVVVMVSDVDAYCTKLRQAGVAIEYGPVVQPYGLREFEALDLEGHRWWFASSI